MKLEMKLRSAQTALETQKPLGCCSAEHRNARRVRDGVRDEFVRGSKRLVMSNNSHEHEGWCRNACEEGGATTNTQRCGS
jgi:hypothetical protein